MDRWLDQYASPYPIRCRGAFHLYSTQRLDNGAPRLVIIPSETAQRDAAAERLTRLANAHATVSIDGVAVFAEKGTHGDIPYVAFDLDVIDDGEGVVARLGATGTKLVFSVGIAVVDRLAAALARAHEHLDPSTGSPLAMGHMSWSNLMFARDGSIHWLGFGHNVVVLTETDVPSGTPSVYTAPEVANRALPTPSGDVHAFVLFQRSMLGYAVLPAEVEDAFAGSVDDDGAEPDTVTQAVLHWVNHNVLAASPRRRATMKEVLNEWRREWRGLGAEPDLQQLNWLIRELAADEHVSPTIEESQESLTVPRDLSWVRTPSGQRHDLTRRRALRGMLGELVSAHRAGSESVTVDALLEAGWPGERPIREAGLNRVYVALTTLRKMDLKEVLQRTDAGYRLAPELLVRVDDDA